jgi:voltage-gated potassium channel Kch
MVPSRINLSALFIRLMAVARYRFIVELTAIFLVVWALCGVLVYVFEAPGNLRLESVWDALYAMLVTMTTSGDSAVAPQTTGGRWVMAVALLASKLLTALLCALAAAVLIERKVREEMGLKMHPFDQHIVIIGWNLKGPHLLQTLRHDPLLAHQPIVVMADMEQKPVSDPLLHFTRSSNPIRGEALERAGLERASTVVVLANYNEKSHADALTAINCMMCRQANPHARIIVELLDPAQRPYMEAAGANQVVGIGEVGGFLLAEATIGNEPAKQLLAHVAEGIRQQKQANTADPGAPARPSTQQPACVK